MFHKLIYQKKAVYSQADVDSFSTKDYTCVKLMRTKRESLWQSLRATIPRTGTGGSSTASSRWSSRLMRMPCASAVTASLN